MWHLKTKIYVVFVVFDVIDESAKKMSRKI